jgi:hypothetical protein
MVAEEQRRKEKDLNTMIRMREGKQKFYGNNFLSPSIKPKPSQNLCYLIS